MHAVLLRQIDRIVGVLHALEAREPWRRVHADVLALLRLARDVGTEGSAAALVRLGHPAPDDAARKHLVEGLQDDEAVLEVLEQVEHAGLNAERVEPEREDAGLAFALRVEILDDTVVLRLLLVEGLETRVRVEEVGDEGEVQARVAGEQRRGREVLPAADVRGVLQDLFGPRAEIAGLQRRERAVVGLELVEEDGVVLAVLDVAAEVVDSATGIRIGMCWKLTDCVPPLPAGCLQVVVEPTKQNLVGCEPE